MEVMTAAEFVQAYEAELRALSTYELGFPRRREAQIHYVQTRDEFIKNVEYYVDHLKLGIAGFVEDCHPEPVENYCDGLMTEAIEIMSLLYAAGASHGIWRRWARLVAQAAALSGRPLEAVGYAALGGEDDFAPKLQATNTDNWRFELKVIWNLLGGQPAAPVPESIKVVWAGHYEDDLWLSLSRSIVARDHEKTEATLVNLADFWLGESGDDWDDFDLEAVPAFHQWICAAAALAKRRGYSPIALSPLHLRYLDAGLADDDAISPPMPERCESPRDDDSDDDDDDSDDE